MVVNSLYDFPKCVIDGFRWRENLEVVTKHLVFEVLQHIFEFSCCFVWFVFDCCVSDILPIFLDFSFSAMAFCISMEWLSIATFSLES